MCVDTIRGWYGGSEEHSAGANHVNAHGMMLIGTNATN